MTTTSAEPKQLALEDEGTAAAPPPSTPKTFTAKELAAMPATEARAALVKQECAHMERHHGERLRQEVGEALFSFTPGRVECFGLDGRKFVWEVYEQCGFCGDLGELLGHDGKMRDCPECNDCCTEIFRTDYDGKLLGVDE